MDKQRWITLMEHLGTSESLDMFDQLEKAYSESHRAYHTSDHIEDCLSQLDEVFDLAKNADEIETALWFHDAIYSVRTGGNERKSAKLAIDFLRGTGVSNEFGVNVNRHILATEHQSVPADPDTALTVDIDLSILGADTKVYDEFENNIRKEYDWVPEQMYVQKRKTILNGFLRREAIYNTEYFQKNFESAARRNLARQIKKL